MAACRDAEKQQFKRPGSLLASLLAEPRSRSRLTQAQVAKRMATTAIARLEKW